MISRLPFVPSPVAPEFFRVSRTSACVGFHAVFRFLLVAGKPVGIILWHSLTSLRNDGLAETNDHDLYRLQRRGFKLWLQQGQYLGAALDLNENLPAFRDGCQHVFERGNPFGRVTRMLPASNISFEARQALIQAIDNSGCCGAIRFVVLS